VTALLLLAAVLGAQAVGLEGVVRSADSGEPIAYAQVRVVGDSLLDWTDEDGRYRLDGLGQGDWTIRVVHPGHDSLDLGVIVPGDRDVRLDVTLRARSGPPVDTLAALADFEPFQVIYTLPALLNPDAVKDMIRRRYPAALALRRVGGEAVLSLWLDERGQVVRSVLTSSSGEPDLDAIAMEVSDSMRFRPARNRYDPVRVIVRIPVLFTVPDSVRGAG
jgi:TonB family protein